MSIIIETVYPCEKCNVEINPSQQFCQHCGAKQTPLSEKLHYNIFYRQQGSESAFNMRYGGIVLSLEDAEALARETVKVATNYEAWIGSFMPEDRTEVKDYATEIQVQNWIPVSSSGKLLEDKGRQSVTVTYRE